MRCLPFVLVVVCLAGCRGESGPELYQLHGEVTFDGKPVPYGRIEFEPDTAKGNSGGLGYAEIVDGKYDTAAAGGRGVVGGAHVVRFSGMASKPATPQASADGTLDETAPPPPQPEQLFSQYSQPHDLPAQDGVLNFELPAEAAATLQAGPATRRRSNDP